VVVGVVVANIAGAFEDRQAHTVSALWVSFVLVDDSVCLLQIRFCGLFFFSLPPAHFPLLPPPRQLVGRPRLSFVVACRSVLVSPVHPPVLGFPDVLLQQNSCLHFCSFSVSFPSAFLFVVVLLLLFEFVVVVELFAAVAAEIVGALVLVVVAGLGLVSGSDPGLLLVVL